MAGQCVLEMFGRRKQRESIESDSQSVLWIGRQSNQVGINKRTTMDSQAQKGKDARTRTHADTDCRANARSTIGKLKLFRERERESELVPLAES